MAFAGLEVPRGVEEDELGCIGLPRDNAVNRQNARLSDRKLSAFPSANVDVTVAREVGPGKNRAKAALQACGVVTKP
jgi:hypothetical protein